MHSCPVVTNSLTAHPLQSDKPDFFPCLLERDGLHLFISIFSECLSFLILFVIGPIFQNYSVVPVTYFIYILYFLKIHHIETVSWVKRSYSLKDQWLRKTKVQRAQMRTSPKDADWVTSKGGNIVFASSLEKYCPVLMGQESCPLLGVRFFHKEISR